VRCGTGLPQFSNFGSSGGDETVSNPHFDSLLSFLLGFAGNILPSQDSVAPFAAAVTGDGKIQPMAAYEGERGSTQGLVDLLIEGMRAAVDAGKIVAGGLCTDVRVQPPNGAALVDAINVHLEHENGECVDVFLPYERHPPTSYATANCLRQKLKYRCSGGNETNILRHT